MDTVKLRGILADLIRARIALGAGRSSEKITIEQAQKLIGHSYDALTDAVAACATWFQKLEKGRRRLIGQLAPD